MRRRVIAISVVVGLVAAVCFALPSVKRGLMARNCLANMKSIGYAATVWSQDHNGASPTNWLCFSTELITPKMMLCPGDPGRTSVSEWARFGPENTSYEIVEGGGRWGDSNRVFFRCKLHGYVCMGDGLVLRQAPPPR
jgi:hypothetical protein